MSYSRLEPYDGKLSRTVLRGASSLVTDLWAGNGPRLLDNINIMQGDKMRNWFDMYSCKYFSLV
jgi:hypothetical protein